MRSSLGSPFWYAQWLLHLVEGAQHIQTVKEVVPSPSLHHQTGTLEYMFQRQVELMVRRPTVQ